MLTARPVRPTSWSFAVEDGRQSVAALELHRWKDLGTVRVGDVPFELTGLGWTGRRFGLVFEGVEVASAQRRGVLRPEYRVQVAAGLLGSDAPLDLTLGSSLLRWHSQVLLGGREVGSIRRHGLFRRHAEIDVAEALPLGVQVFLLALVIIEWRRAARSA